MQATTLIRLDSPNDPDIGGVLITFPSGTKKTAHWKHRNAVTDPLSLAKDLAAKLLQACLDEQRFTDADGTNWPSVTAACRAIVIQFNEGRLAGAEGIGEPEAPNRNH